MGDRSPTKTTTPLDGDCAGDWDAPAAQSDAQPFSLYSSPPPVARAQPPPGPQASPSKYAPLHAGGSSGVPPFPPGIPRQGPPSGPPGYQQRNLGAPAQATPSPGPSAVQPLPGRWLLTKMMQAMQCQQAHAHAQPWAACMHATVSMLVCSTGILLCAVSPSLSAGWLGMSYIRQPILQLTNHAHMPQPS